MPPARIALDCSLRGCCSQRWCWHWPHWRHAWREVRAMASRASDRAFMALNYLVAAVVAGVLLWILIDMAWQGVQHLSWEFLTEEPRKSGRAGGISSVLVST